MIFPKLSYDYFEMRQIFYQAKVLFMPITVASGRNTGTEDPP
jgi:hypothetical protein